MQAGGFGQRLGTVGLSQRAQQRFIRWLAVAGMDAVVYLTESITQFVHGQQKREGILGLGLLRQRGVLALRH